MSKLNNIRIIEIPAFKAVSSGLATFDELFHKDGFGNWIDANNKIQKNMIYAQLKLYLKKKLSQGNRFLKPKKGDGKNAMPNQICQY